MEEIKSLITQISSEEIISNPQIKVDQNAFWKKLSDIYENSTSIVKSKIVDEEYEQNGVKILFKHLIIDNTKNKPILINKKKYNDPFAPPINPSSLIEDNFCGLNEHRIILTKFPLFKNQVLLVSREFVSQYTHLVYENFRDLVLLINLIDGFGFFNGGMKAGASQPRKHLQAVPFSSLQNKDIGLFDIVKNKKNLKEVYMENNKFFEAYSLVDCDKVNKKNILFRFKEEFTESFKDNCKCESVARILLSMYKSGMKIIGVNNDGENIDKNYSLLLTSEFMFVVPREENEIYITEEDKKNKVILNVNSLSFFFIIVSRTKEQIEEIKKGDLFGDVISKL